MRIRSVGRRIALGVVVAAIVFVFYENVFVHKFQECISANTGAYGENSGNEYAKIIVRIISVFRPQLICTIRTIDKHNGFFGFIATLVIAAFTIILAIVTNQQARLTGNAIKLARDEFNATHRPKIILREAIISPVLEGEPISILFHLANVGETAGTIVRSSVGVEIVPRQQRLLLQGSVEQKDDLGKIHLGPGGAILLPFKGAAPKWETSRFQEKSYMTTSGPTMYRDATIHFFGQFIYMDEMGIPRRTAFRRVLDPEKRRFYRLENEPDLDYSD